MLRRDRDQLWAEAASREAQGASIRLDRSLWAAAGGEQALRRIADPWEEIIAEHLDNREGKLTVEDAWKIVGVGEAIRTQEHNRRLGDAMKKAGWSRGRRRRDGNLRYAYVKGESDRWLRVTRAQQGAISTCGTKMRTAGPHSRKLRRAAAIHCSRNRHPLCSPSCST